MNGYFPQCEGCCKSQISFPEISKQRHLDSGKGADNAGRTLPSTHPKGELTVKQIVAFTKKRLNCSNPRTSYLLPPPPHPSHSLLPKALVNTERRESLSSAERQNV